MNCRICGAQNDDASFRCCKCNNLLQQIQQPPTPQHMARSSHGKYTRDNKETYGTVSKIVLLILLISIILFGTSFLHQNNLPGQENILEELYQGPIQTETDATRFKTTRGESVYTITPLYNYELYGLVVSCHDSQSWLDYYHKRWGDAINIKDICVVWGSNVETEVYKEVEFSSGPFTCYCEYRTDSGFDIFSISNNHLLDDDERTYNEIKSTSPGDQIYLKGYLASYSGGGVSSRVSSTSRTDKGQGACEVIYVTDYQILDKANALWHSIYSLTKYAIIGCVILLIVLFFISPTAIKS